MATQVMGNYNALQTQIRDMHEDYDKEEATLLKELQTLNEQNAASLRNYKQVTHRAQEAKKSLLTIVEAINNKD